MAALPVSGRFNDGRGMLVDAGPALSRSPVRLAVFYRDSASRTGVAELFSVSVFPRSGSFSVSRFPGNHRPCFMRTGACIHETAAVRNFPEVRVAAQKTA